MAGTSTSPARILAMVIDLAIKVATVGLLVYAVLNPDLPQFTGKAFTGRAVAYPFALLLLPILWWLFGRGRIAFPVGADILFGLPFLIDVVGNALDLYDTIWWWDDLNHFINWAILCAAFGQLLLRFPYGKWTMAGLIVGFGSVSGVIWE